MTSGHDDFNNWEFQGEDNYNPMQNSDGSIFYPEIAEQWYTEAVSTNCNNVAITGNADVKSLGLQNGTPMTPEKTTPLPLPSITSWFQVENKSQIPGDKKIANKPLSSKYYPFKDQGRRVPFPGYGFSQYMNGHQDQGISMADWNGLPSPCWNCGALPKSIGEISSPNSEIQIISPSPSNLERTQKDEQNEVNAFIYPSDLTKRRTLAVSDIQKRLRIAGKPIPSDYQILNLWKRRQKQNVEIK
ncbi:hypothetical protein CRE_22831 [Caenorhabditis remanei]|uniref:Uncharacterized protein n=1 Tax=Caenorhabditis remanei TaxID=31234 RepID=E3MHG6_CAERE|nr:hypothetical protein CRE_22831 [Caenorhabditis remanei]